MSFTTFVDAPRLIDLDQLRTELAAVGYTGEVGKVGNRIGLDMFALGDLTLEQIRAVVDTHKPDEIQQLDQLITKARQVWNGQGSFTPAQAQKILAGLVLLEARRLR